eukprot:668146-Pelagomonas_calceolata.AAC.1
MRKEVRGDPLTPKDARLFDRDVYALVVGFASAFNTTDRDQLLWIIYDCGFPSDAIDTVENIVPGVTRVRLSSGHFTREIPKREGHHPGKHTLSLPFPHPKEREKEKTTLARSSCVH